MIVHLDGGEYQACFSMWAGVVKAFFTPVISLQKCSIEACNVKLRQVRIYSPPHMVGKGTAPVVVTGLSVA